MSTSAAKAARRIPDENEGQGQLELNRVLSSLSVAPTHSAQHDEKEWDREIDRRIEELRAGKHAGVALSGPKKKIVLRVSERA